MYFSPNSLTGHNSSISIFLAVASLTYFLRCLYCFWSVKQEFFYLWQDPYLQYKSDLFIGGISVGCDIQWFVGRTHLQMKNQFKPWALSEGKITIYEFIPIYCKIFSKKKKKHFSMTFRDCIVKIYSKQKLSQKVDFSTQIRENGFFKLITRVEDIPLYIGIPASSVYHLYCWRFEKTFFLFWYVVTLRNRFFNLLWRCLCCHRKQNSNLLIVW